MWRKTLHAVTESIGAHTVKRPLSGMAKRRMTQVMAERNRLHQIFVQLQRLRDRPGILADFQRMGQARSVMIPLMPCTLEGKVVRLSDKIAYIHHDMDDAIRGGILKESDVPKEIGDVIGYSCGQRLDYFIHDIVTTSRGQNDNGQSWSRYSHISVSPPVLLHPAAAAEMPAACRYPQDVARLRREELLRLTPMGVSPRSSAARGANLSRLVYIFKHKLPQFVHGFRHIGRHPNIVLSAACCHNIMNQSDL